MLNALRVLRAHFPTQILVIFSTWFLDRFFVIFTLNLEGFLHPNLCLLFLFLWCFWSSFLNMFFNKISMTNFVGFVKSSGFTMVKRWFLQNWCCRNWSKESAKSYWFGGSKRRKNCKKTLNFVFENVLFFELEFWRIWCRKLPNLGSHLGSQKTYSPRLFVMNVAWERHWHVSFKTHVSTTAK